MALSVYELFVASVLLSAFCSAREIGETIATVTQTSPPPSSVRLRASSPISVAAPKEGLNKRDIKVNNFSGTSSAKSYDPPPEFYRGPGSSSSSTSTGAESTYSSHNNHDSLAAGFLSKPITFPDSTGRHKYGGDSVFNSWQLLRGHTAGYGPGEDRLSVGGHYGGSPDHHANNLGYSYETHPYPAAVPQHHHVEYIPANSYYPSTTNGGDGGGGGGYYSASSEGLPFDVYGSKGHYAGAGGEYSYTYPDMHEPPAHKGYGGDLEKKALLAKSFLIPLASAAVLGIAAALVSNPLLLQLGTVSGIGGPSIVAPAVVGKRKRRGLVDLSAAEQESPPADTLAYRAHQQQQKQQQQYQRSLAWL